MTISQTHLHEIAEAGRRILTIFEGHLATLRHALDRNRQGDLTNDALYGIIVSLGELPEASLSKPRAILAAEAAHYAATARKNKREQRRRGVEPSSQADPNAPFAFTPSPRLRQTESRFTDADRQAYERAVREQEEEERQKRKAELDRLLGKDTDIEESFTYAPGQEPTDDWGVD